jgi:alkaline phosphatase D
MQRRELLKLAAAAAVPGAWQSAPALAAPRTAEHPFPLGVASGPGDDGAVVLWTRVGTGIATDIERLSHLSFHDYLAARAKLSLAQADAIDVRWEIAGDERFRTIVRRGTATAHATLGHSVHVEVPGLAADRWYWYRFLLGGATSAVGRTRPLPRADAPLARLRIALASCQHYEYGYFGAYRAMRADAPDLVLFVGDYIYEGRPRDRRFRTHPFPAARTLDDYRLRHALYRLDPDLQAMHAFCPWLTTWDDHEVSNDYAGDHGEEPAIDGAARRAAAYQAYYEHMPLPASVLIKAYEEVRLYRRLSFGSLASFAVLDDRQYRDPQACPPPGRGGSNVVDDEACPERRDPKRALLGRTQMEWLGKALADRSARWNFIVQQTLFSPLKRAATPPHRYWTDGWDGYPGERERVLALLARDGARNQVILGGDVHTNYVCDVKRDFERPDAPAIATEFCGTSITSASSWDAARVAGIAAANPHVHLANSTQRGYALGELEARALTMKLRVVDDVTLRAPAVSTLATFVVEDGRAGAQRA